MREDERHEDGAAACARARIDGMKGMIHPQIRALHRYFEELRGDREVPLRAEVDPRDMPCRASNLFILEDLGRGRLRFRLAGSGLLEAFGADLRGTDPRRIMQGRGGASLAALIAECLAEPGIGCARLARADLPEEIWETLLLPMRSDAGGIDRVLGSLVPLAGTPAPRQRVPLRFAIAEMTIRPIRPGQPATAPRPAGAAGAAGFAEAEQTPFAGPRGGLTAIEGGLSAEDAPERPEPGAAAHLRVVRDD